MQDWWMLKSPEEVDIKNKKSILAFAMTAEFKCGRCFRQMQEDSNGAFYKCTGGRWFLRHPLYMLSKRLAQAENGKLERGETPVYFTPGFSKETK
ncbi:MAG: hypothetical protein AAB546_02155 [Patescibacteria group bacterium]